MSREWKRQCFIWLDQVLVDQTLSGIAFKIAYVFVSRYFNEDEDGAAWPSETRLAKDLGCSQSGAQKAVRQLVTRGHLACKIGRGRGKSNRYWMLLKGDTTEPDEKGNASSSFKRKNTDASTSFRKRENTDARTSFKSENTDASTSFRPENTYARTSDSYYSESILIDSCESRASTRASSTDSEKGKKSWPKRPPKAPPMSGYGPTYNRAKTPLPNGKTPDDEATPAAKAFDTVHIRHLILTGRPTVGCNPYTVEEVINEMLETGELRRNESGKLQSRCGYRGRWRHCGQ
jgi:hypothetical protein